MHQVWYLLMLKLTTKSQRSLHEPTLVFTVVNQDGPNLHRDRSVFFRTHLEVCHETGCQIPGLQALTEVLIGRHTFVTLYLAVTYQDRNKKIILNTHD